MISVRFTLNKNEQAVKKYITDRLSKLSVSSVKLKETKKFIFIDVETETKCFLNIAKDIVCSVILTFYKFEALLTGVAFEDKDNLVFYALLGALLFFDSEAETLIIEKVLNNMNVFSVRTIFEFRNEKLRESWKSIITLTNKLLSQCHNDDDLFDLVFFLLSVDNRFSPKIKIDGGNVYADNIYIPVAELTGDTNRDTLIAVIKEQPSSIVITDSDAVAPELLKVIKKLGED